VFDVFVNYRTVDARFGAAAAYQFLVGRFGSERVFLDHVSMGSGAVYPEEIRAALEQTRVLVVLIGPEWLSCEPGTDVRLVDREGDWVRREIRRALARRIEIIPVLLDGTGFPTELPVDIAGLLLRQTAEIRHRSLNSDLTRLADDIVARVPELALPDLLVEERELPPDPLPSELLRPEYRVVDFAPADDHLDRLVTWLTEPVPLAVRLLIGPGGRGKTRIATELVGRARTAGWQAGFVREVVDLGVLARVKTVRRPMLLVVDYAEGRAAQVVALLEELIRRPADWDGARLLLLARSPGQWQRALERHDDPRIAVLVTGMTTESVARIAAGPSRRVQFELAATAFSRELAREPARLLDAAMPAVPADLDHDRYDRMLDVHAAALAAVLDGGCTQVMPVRTDPVRRVLDHEERYWLRSAPEHGLPVRPGPLREVVAAATLVGADRPSAARSVLGAIRRLDTAGRGVIADYAAWLAHLYPGDGALNPLRPDRLGEDLIASVLDDYPELAEELAPVVDDRQLLRALTVLARAARRHSPVVRNAMRDLLSVEPAARVAIGMTVATQVDDPTLIEVLGTLRGDYDLSAVVVANLPDSSLALAAFAVTHTKALLRAESRRAEMDLGFVAELRHNLALRLSAVGEYDLALTTAAEAVQDYRILVTGPDDEVELAGALTCLASCYAQLGLYADGEPSVAEAVELLDRLATGPPSDLTLPDDELGATRADALITLADLRHEQGDADNAVTLIERAITIIRDLWTHTSDFGYLNRLASALESLASIHSTRGELRASLVAATESAKIYRELDAEELDSYRGDLIRALGNLAGAHAELGLWAQGAELGEEAVTLARSLVTRHGDSHLVRLADTMNNTAALLRRLDEHERALAYLDQVVPLYRGLADRLPGAHLTNLAGALQNLGNCLDEMDRPREAVDAYEESIEIYRKLSGPQRDDTDESLAETLVGLAHARVALDDEEMALELVTEAVDMLDRVMRTERMSTRRKLAHALHLASATAFDLDQFERAVRDAERAAALFTIVVANDDGRDVGDEHAAVLHALARALDANGDYDRATSAFTEAIGHYRAQPGTEARECLAGVLVNAGVCATNRDDMTAAVDFTTEAITSYRDLAAEGVEVRFGLAEALNNLADLYCDLEDWKRAVEPADEAIALATILHAEQRLEATSLLVCMFVTRARAAGPNNAASTISALRDALTIAAADDELRDLVHTWAQRLNIPIRKL
jgi:tetratricopeptide (TPR) repeat protein